MPFGTALDGGPGVDVTLSVIILADGTTEPGTHSRATGGRRTSPPDSATVGYPIRLTVSSSSEAMGALESQHSSRS